MVVYYKRFQTSSFHHNVISIQATDTKMGLLERDTVLRELDAERQEAVGGEGRALLISGEAGIGKTALVEQFICQRQREARILSGACNDLFTPRPLGPLHDVASQTQGQLSRLLQAETDRSLIFSACLSELQSQPTIVVIEDVHWADEATLDLLKFLGRRIHLTRALLLVTYRDDELGQQHPLRLLLGDLATSTAVRRMALTPLSVEAVRQLAAERPIDAELLYRQTGGNPFYVTEVLAAGKEGVPPTVRDAVLARAARLSLSGRAVLNAAAVIGMRVEPWLLAEVTWAEAGAVNESLDIGLLLAQGDTLAFRHELARQAILDSILPHQRVFLHQAVLDALKVSPLTRSDLTRLAHHAEAAGDREAVLEYAPPAARQAVAMNAHREAAALYALALCFGHGLPADRHALLLEAYAQECEIIDQQAEGIAARRRAVDLWRGLGNRLKQGENLARSVSMLTRSGQKAEAQRTSRAALDILEALPPGRELALAQRVQATLYLVNRDCQEALDRAQKSLDLAERFQDTEVLATARIATGTAWLFLDYERGCEHLERSLAIARDAGLDAWVAYSYTNLGSGSGELYQFQRAERYLAEGIAYAAERDLDRSRLYMLAWQALTYLHLGRWRDAAETASAVLHNPRVNANTRIRALIALGRIRARRGDPSVDVALDEALELAARTDTIQDLGPAHAARAEAAWLAGSPELTLREACAAYNLAASKQHPWLAGELAYWLWKAGEAIEVPQWVARPFALQIAGDWRAAADEWERLGCPYEQARALADGDGEAQIAALTILEQLGARPMADIVRQRLRDIGVQAIPRGPRAATRENPFGLTNRQVEILALLTENLTNAEIAARLHISPKTVDHHVSAVLAKLAVSSRTEAAVLARQHPDL